MFAIKHFAVVSMWGHSWLSENNAELISGAVGLGPHDSQATGIINQTVWGKKTKLMLGWLPYIPQDEAKL